MGLLHGVGDAARREPRAEGVCQGAQAAKLPGFRLYDLRRTFRVAAPRSERAHHVRERAARAHGRDDDAALYAR